MKLTCKHCNATLDGDIKTENGEVKLVFKEKCCYNMQTEHTIIISPMKKLKQYFLKFTFLKYVMIFKIEIGKIK